MEETVQIVKKYAKPTAYDLAAYKSVWQAIKDKGQSDYYIQCSSDCLSPQWVPLGIFLEKAFEEFKLKKDFIDAAFDLYNGKTEGLKGIEMIVGVKK